MQHGIYIHYPYCIHKCSYCDFYSLEGKKSESDYLIAILKEIELRASNTEISADTIFFGGGTPSLMNPKLLEKILNQLQKYFKIDSKYEFTLECNPGTVDLQYFYDYKSLGVNRISFGVQSFNESELTFLERIHSSSDVAVAFDIARKVGFDNISLDLIFAIPGQTIETWANTIKQAISLEPNHISTYSLIYEEGTPLFTQLKNKKFTTQSEESDVSFYELAVNEYKNAGYEQYEVSNFAKDGKECKHNLKYWSSEEYYAFGPSAHGYVDGYRYANYRNIGKYLKNLKSEILPEESREKVALTEKIYERLYLELRAKGLDFKKFENDFNFNLFELSTYLIQKLINDNYGSIENDKLKLTSIGYFIGDEITLKFMKIVDNYLAESKFKEIS